MKFSLAVIGWFGALLVLVVAISISFLWLDRPVASFMHDHFGYLHRRGVDDLSNFPNPLLLLAIVLSVVFGLRMILRRPLSWNQANIFICSLTVIFTETAKNLLKLVFGRTWPETWVQDNASFIRDGVYGFHFMHGGVAFQSFPSGHMAAACTVISVLWIRYPDFRSYYLAAVLLIGASLVVGNFHFLSDVLAGAFLGLSNGWIALLIWDRFAGRGMACVDSKMGLRDIAR